MNIKKTPIALAVSLALLTQHSSLWAADQATTTVPQTNEAANEATKNAKLVAPCVRLVVASKI